MCQSDINATFRLHRRRGRRLNLYSLAIVCVDRSRALPLQKVPGHRFREPESGGDAGRHRGRHQRLTPLRRKMRWMREYVADECGKRADGHLPLE